MMHLFGGSNCAILKYSKENIMIRYGFALLVLFLLAGCSSDGCPLNNTSLDGSWSLYCEGIYMEFCKDGEQFDLFTEPIFQTSFNELVIDEKDCTFAILLDGELGYRFKIESLDKNEIRTIHLPTGEKVDFKRIESTIYSIHLKKEEKGDFWHNYHNGFQSRMIEFYRTR